MEKKPLRFMPYAQAAVISLETGEKVLLSYDTLVCGIRPDGTIWCRGLYSATTRRHISAFAREFGRTYEDFKREFVTSKIV